MATVHEAGVDDDLRLWIEPQPAFFVATAPSTGGSPSCGGRSTYRHASLGCKGRPAAHPRVAGFTDLDPLLPTLPGSRAIIEGEADRLSTSYGDSVPLMELTGERDRLVRWARAKGDDGLVVYAAEENATSIDGLPSLG